MRPGTLGRPPKRSRCNGPETLGRPPNSDESDLRLFFPTPSLRSWWHERRVKGCNLKIGCSDFFVFSFNLKLSSPGAESARAVTGRRCSHSGVGEDFLARRPGSPHENGRNSETKSRTIDPKVPKRNQRRGLRAPLCQKTRSHTKKRIFGPKSGFLGPKKNIHFWSLTMF